jgi:hypothetical protein
MSSYDYENFFFRFGENFLNSNLNPVFTRDSLEEFDNRNATATFNISKDHAQGYK